MEAPRDSGMGAGAAITRMPHGTGTQNTYVTTTNDNEAGEPHRAGTRSWSGGQGSTCARAKITRQPAPHQCATPTGLIRMFLTMIPDMSL